jgi:competence protein ComEC
VVVLVVIAIWTWPSSDKLTIVFCDVGQGDGAIIISGNFQMLIDVGPENNKMVGCLGKHVPFWDKTIEVAVITHGDSDHGGGLKQVEGYYNVQNIYSGSLVKNDVIKYGLISFEVLNPDRDWGNDNDNSVVGILNYKENKILFLGDVTKQVEQKMIWRNEILGKINIIKISHHGSAEATSEELLKAVVGNGLQPFQTTAIISVGKNNKFGHPTGEVLERLTKFGVKIRRTDEEGEIVIIL